MKIDLTDIFDQLLSTYFFFFNYFVKGNANDCSDIEFPMRVISDLFMLVYKQ